MNIKTSYQLPMILAGLSAGIWSFCASLFHLPVQAQITPDGTLPINSIITERENIREITGGTQVGQNLFHSFQEFSVPGGITADFQNSPAIQNIITRITGNSISDINGILKARGSANLFLINPNGIRFGETARLQLGGSFFAATASSILFADGTEFSAKKPQSPLLTMSVPIGLQFNAPSGNIEVQGRGHDLVRTNPSLFSPPVRAGTAPSLQVRPGKTMALFGGNISLKFCGIFLSSSSVSWK